MPVRVLPPGAVLTEDAGFRQAPYQRQDPLVPDALAYFFLKSSAFFSITFFILLNILYELIPYTITESGSLYIFFFLRLSLSMLLGILL